MSSSPTRHLTPEQLGSFHRDGYLIIEDFFSTQQMDVALAAAERIAYGMPFTQWRETVAAQGQGKAVADGIGAHDNPGRAQFPTGEAVLDRLIGDDRLLDVIAELLGTDAVSYLNGHLFVRAAPTDRRHPPHPWEGFHFDHPTGSMLPPAAQPGIADYLGCGILLADCDEDCAPTVLVPGSHRLVAERYAQWVREGVLLPPNSFTDIREVPELAGRRRWTGRRGSLGLSSSYLVHTAVPFANPTRQRVWWTMSVGRTADLPYNRFTTPFAPAERPYLASFLADAPARVRTLFGWPPPGHRYYTQETLAGLHLQYPTFDFTAYGGGPAGAAPPPPAGWVNAPSGGIQRAS